jgi:hypothetical protein
MLTMLLMRLRTLLPAGLAALVLAGTCAGGCDSHSSAAGDAGASGEASLPVGGRGGGASSGGAGDTENRAGTSSVGGAGASGHRECPYDPSTPEGVSPTADTKYALDCRCRLWWNTDQATLPSLSWGVCPAGVLEGRGCEQGIIPGYDDWSSRALEMSTNPADLNAPSGVIAVSRNFYHPTIRSVRLWWVRMSDLAIRGELASDQAVGDCATAVSRVAPGRLLAEVGTTEQMPSGKFSGATGFVLLSERADGGIDFAASEPYVGQSHYVPTSDSVYSRLFDGKVLGNYVVDGLSPKGPWLDTSPFGAFPEYAQGADLILEIDQNPYPGVGLFNKSDGFQPMLPPSPARDSGSSDLGTDGKVWVWTAMKDRTGEFRFATRDVATAPYTTSPATLAATTRRVTRARGGLANGPWTVGCGYAAQRWEWVVQVVRLSDGATWIAADETTGGSFSPRSLTCEHLYGTLDDGTPMRLQLDQLGAPTPAE